MSSSVVLEFDFRADVVQLCELRGWCVHYAHGSWRSQPGLPPYGTP